MKPCDKPWSQLKQEEKIETLRVELTHVRRAVNRLYRLIEAKNEERS